MHIRLILNGKKAHLDSVRSAVQSVREHADVEVRVTWEQGDVGRMVREAVAEGCRRLVAGGGDGTVKEVVEALMHLAPGERPELAIMPLGTANDFATACMIPQEPSSALTLAQGGTAVAIDCVKANLDYYINVASGGFGAQLTASTPVELKNFLGGGAYTLSGLVQAINFVPYRGELRLPDMILRDSAIVGAICNGRQAGGGQVLAPQAKLDDGLLDIVVLLDFPKEKALQVLKEVQNPALDGEFVRRFKTPWAEIVSDGVAPINLDGEPLRAETVRFEVLPAAVRLVLPENCPMIG